MATKSRLTAYADGIKKLNEKQNSKESKKTSVLMTLSKEKTKKEEH